MTQEGVVTRVFENGMAEVAVTRSTACGGSCGCCEACVYQGELKQTARNLVNAVRGQRVVIQSKTSMVFKAAALVYIMPLALFLLGYVIGYLCGGSEGVCVALSFAGLAIGGVLIVASQRRKHGETGINFDIIELLE